MRVFSSLLLSAVLTACTGTPNDGSTAQAESAAIDAQGAVDLFNNVCLASAPDFVGAEERMIRMGLTVAESNGAREHPSGTASAKVQQRPSRNGVLVERCSVVFSDADHATASAALRAALAARKLAADAPPKEAMIGQRRVQIWDVAIDGRPARVLLVPGRSRAILPGIYLDVPAASGAA